jgi:hypothetical protein
MWMSDRGSTSAPSHASSGPASRALTGRRRAVLRPLRCPAVVLAGTAYVAAVDPNTAGHYPTCPFLAITGWYCPGCGALRAVHALAHGDLVTALARNPIVVVVLGCVVIAGAFWLGHAITGRQRRRQAPPWLLYSLLGTILLFWVLRNVPGWTWLSPT